MPVLIMREHAQRVVGLGALRARASIRESEVEHPLSN